MDFSFGQFRRFVQREANDAVRNATGIDPMANVNQVRYQAADVGLRVDPESMIRTNGSGSGSGGLFSRAAKPKVTKKERLVGSVEEFIKLRDSIAKKPHGGAVLLVHALLNWADAATHEVGRQMLVLAVAEDVLVEGSTYKQYALRPELEEQLQGALAAGAAAAVRSLVAGTASATGYSVNPKAVALAHDPKAEDGQEVKSGLFTVHLCSSGDPATTRPVHLAMNKNGVWKARDFSSLLGEVAATPVTVTAADDL